MAYTSTFEFDKVKDLWIVICIWAVAGTIAGVVATQIVARVNKKYLGNKDFEALNIVDERDSETDHRAMLLTYKVTSTGSFLAMVTIVVVYPPLIMFIWSGLIGQIPGDIYRLRLYSSNSQ
jgi:hypothetical protein